MLGCGTPSAEKEDTTTTANGRLAMMAIIGMFFQDGLTGSAWGDWANYTASPLRAFETELAGAKSSADCTWYALTGATAAGSATLGWGAVSTKVQSDCVLSTVFEGLVSLICMFALAVQLSFDFVFHFEILSGICLCVAGLLDFIPDCSSLFACFLLWRFCACAWLFCIRPRLRRFRRVLPCRFAGRRRLCRSRRASIPRPRLRRFLLPRWLPFLASGLLSLPRHILHQIGLLATRVGEASHPGPAASSVPSDPWASYMNAKNSKPTLRAAASRSRWIDCGLDLSQFALDSLPGVACISPDSFAENACGIVLLNRALFADSFRVRSKSPLAVVLPGGQNSDLKKLGFSDSAISVHWLFIRDPLDDRWARKLVTIVQMGTQAVLPTSLDDGPAWDVSSTCEFSALLSRRLLQSDDAWKSFIADARSRVPLLLRDLHADLKSVEFYSWSKLDATTHRVSFRAPFSCTDCLLSASGVKVPFCINLVCRDDASREARSQTSAVVWLGKLSYNDSLVLIKQLDNHLGLVMSKQSFGIRSPVSALDVVRKLAVPHDSKFSAVNLKIRGDSLYQVSGLPIGATRAEVISQFAAWKVGMSLVGSSFP